MQGAMTHPSRALNLDIKQSFFMPKSDITALFYAKERYIYIYNPSNNFCELSLDKTDHLIQNRTMVIRGYLPSDLIPVV